MERKKFFKSAFRATAVGVLVAAPVICAVGEGLGIVDVDINTHEHNNQTFGLTCDEALIYTTPNPDIWGNPVKVVQGRIQVNGQEIIPYTNWLTYEQLPDGPGTGQHFLPNEIGTHTVKVSVRAGIVVGDTTIYIARETKSVTLICLPTDTNPRAQTTEKNFKQT